MNTSLLVRRFASRLGARIIVTCFLAAVSPPLSLAERGEIIIPAADLAAPDQRADTPTPGKWWLNRNAQDWGAPKARSS